MLEQYIKTLDELYRIATRSEVIIWAVGDIGTATLDLLCYTGKTNGCIVLQERASSFNNFIYDIPVIDLKVMRHFCDTATFIVAAPTDKSDVLCQTLTAHGCKKIFGLTIYVKKSIAEMLQKMRVDGAVTMWFMNRMTNRLNRVERNICMQNEICRVNTAAFEQYRNCFRGKTVVLVNNGASAKYYKPIDGAVHIAVAGAYRRTDFVSDFVFTHESGDFGNSLETELPKIRHKAFLGKFVEPKSGGYPECLNALRDKAAQYFIGENTFGQMICEDITCRQLTDFWGAWSAAFQFALFTFPDEIRLVGCDITTNDTHAALKRIGYARLKMLAAHLYPSTRISTVNPIGLKGLFQEIYTDEYLATLAERR